MMRVWLWLWIAQSSYALASSGSGTLNLTETNKPPHNAGEFNVSVELCDAAILAGTSSDQARIVRKSHGDGLDMVRIDLGSEHFGATYSATFCLLVDSSKGKNKHSDVDASLTLTNTNLSDNSNSYIDLAKLQLLVTLICEEDRREENLYSGPFDQLAITISWSLPIDKQCKLNLVWIEKSNALRPWHNEPASIAAMLRFQPTVR